MMQHMRAAMWAVILLSAIGYAGAPALALADDARPATAPPDSTEERFERLMEVAQERDLHEQPLGQIMQAIGQQFMDAPYLEGTLDEGDEETLVIRFDGFDCVTYVETVLALARTINDQAYDFETFADHMQAQRYRGGGDIGYCNRLHYFSEWIADNEVRGAVNDLTADLGGEELGNVVGFMSANREAYPRFATNDSLLACVQDMERELAEGGHTLHYVPQEDIPSIYDELQSGDIIGLATDIEGLDVAHTGLVYEDEDNIGMLHASLDEGVVIEFDLQQYVTNIDHQVGIVVARPTQ